MQLGAVLRYLYLRLPRRDREVVVRMEWRVSIGALLTVLALLSRALNLAALKILVYRDNVVIKTYSRPNAEYNSRSINVPYTAIEGILVYPDPKNACQPVQQAPVVNDTFVFAFIEEYSTCRGRSERYLADANYDAMVAYTAPTDYLVGEVKIPQVLLDDDIFKNFLRDNAITNDTSNLNPNTTVYVSLRNDTLNLELLFIVFGVILLAALFISISIFCCSLCWRVLVVKWHNRGLSRWQVRRLPKRKYRRSKDGACETCSICLEEFKEGESVRVLPCDHVFHPKCVDIWLQKWNRTCPLCKSAIKRQGKPLFTEDPESSHLLSESGAASIRTSEERDDNEPDGAGGNVSRHLGGASNYGSTEQTSPLRLVASGRHHHRRSASSGAAGSNGRGPSGSIRSNQLSQSGSRYEPTVTTIELNVTSSDEASRSASRSVSGSPSPNDSPSQYHTPRESDGEKDDKTNPSFKTANGESSITSSVRV